MVFLPTRVRCEVNVDPAFNDSTEHVRQEAKENGFE